jgi:hypothetical protein
VTDRRQTNSGDPANTSGASVPPTPIDPNPSSSGASGVRPEAAAQTSERPVIERLGLAAIALLLVAVFAALGYAAVGSGEVFLGVMAWIGALMTFWAAASTLRRG